MKELYKVYEHSPPHLFRANAKYFITGSTYQKIHILASDAAKEKILEYMFKSFKHFGWQIEDVMFGSNGRMALWNPVGVTGGIGSFDTQGAPKSGTLGFGVQRLRRKNYRTLKCTRD